MMYTDKHICNVLSQRYQKRYNTVSFTQSLRNCVFSIECYHNSKFSDPYEQLVWTLESESFWISSPTF